MIVIMGSEMTIFFPYKYTISINQISQCIKNKIGSKTEELISNIIII